MGAMFVCHLFGALQGVMQTYLWAGAHPAQSTSTEQAPISLQPSHVHCLVHTGHLAEPNRCVRSQHTLGRLHTYTAVCWCACEWLVSSSRFWHVLASNHWTTMECTGHYVQCSCCAWHSFACHGTAGARVQDIQAGSTITHAAGDHAKCFLSFTSDPASPIARFTPQPAQCRLRSALRRVSPEPQPAQQRGPAAASPSSLILHIGGRLPACALGRRCSPRVSIRIPRVSIARMWAWEQQQAIGPTLPCAQLSKPDEGSGRGAGPGAWQRPRERVRHVQRALCAASAVSADGRVGVLRI